MLPVFGHQNPDTDAISSAIVYASLLNRQGVAALAYRLGELNFETSFVLKRFNIETPPMLPELPSGAVVALVDHNESSQSAANIKTLQVSRVIDHHKLGDLATTNPPYLRFEPVGCTATVLLKLYREAALSFTTTEAALMLSAILSDTLHFRSPTTTPEDRAAIDFLAPIAQVTNVEEYALEMFAAKSDLGDTPAENILKMDYKEFSFGEGGKWGIGAIETTNPAYVLGRKKELLEAMQAAKDKGGLAGILLCVIDILNETNTTFAPGETEEKVLGGAFGVGTYEQQASLGSLISRKKQIVPALEKYFGA